MNRNALIPLVLASLCFTGCAVGDVDDEEGTVDEAASPLICTTCDNDPSPSPSPSPSPGYGYPDFAVVPSIGVHVDATNHYIVHATVRNQGTNTGFAGVLYFELRSPQGVTSAPSSTELTMQIREALVGMQFGRTEDTFGWMHRVC